LRPRACRLFSCRRGRYHDPLGLCRRNADGLASDDRFLAKIVAGFLEVFARQSRETGLLVVNQRRAVLCAKLYDLFVVTLVANWAIFHNVGVFIRVPAGQKMAFRILTPIGVFLLSALSEQNCRRLRRKPLPAGRRAASD